jgi:predicted DNA-binding transcriptional regulator AlpA
MAEIANSLLNPRDVSKLLRISLPYVYKLADRGLISCIRWECPGEGNRKKTTLRFRLDDIRQFIESHYQKST